MNRRALVVSILFALLGALGINYVVEQEKTNIAGRYGDSVMVLKASKDILEASMIEPTMVELSEIPSKLVEPNAITMAGKFEDADELKKESKKFTQRYVGAISRISIKRGEQITSNKITEAGVRTGLAPQISPGKRAYSISISESTAVAKLIKPGDRVDVIAVSDGGRGRENRSAKTILQDVLVLSTGRFITNNLPLSIEKDPNGPGYRNINLISDQSWTSINLEVTPYQVQELSLFSSDEIRLSLRNNDDVERVGNLPAVHIGDVFQRAPASQGGTR